MPKFQTAAVFEVEADSYEDAIRETENFLNLADNSYFRTESESPRVSLFDPEPSFESDSEGQRVLYLHPIDKPLDDHSD